MPPKSNNGIKYFITETRNAAIGHEYQMIDDSLVKDHAESSTAAFYLVVAPKPDKQVKPFGEWNHSGRALKVKHVFQPFEFDSAVNIHVGARAFGQLA